MSRDSGATPELSTGHVIPFPSRATLPQRTLEPGAGPAEILLFTGIRYERHDAGDSDVNRPPSADDRHPAPAGAGRRGPRRRA